VVDAPVVDAPVNRRAIGRASLVLALYIVVAWFVYDAAGWFRRALALPALFETLLRGGLWVGGPVAALLAWHYPSLGTEGGGTADRSEGTTTESSEG